MNKFHNTDEELRRILKPGPGQSAPEGFADRIMTMVHTESEKETMPLRTIVREYLPYVAAVFAIGISLYFGWQYIPFLKNLGVAESQNAGETILMFHAVLDSFGKVFAIFTASSISVIFAVSVVLFFLVDRLYNAWLHTRKSGTLRLLV